MFDKCLIVDDHEMIRESIGFMTKSLGLKSSILAKDGNDAISKIFHEKPSLVITDLQMEPMDGLELLRTIRSGRYGLPFDIPVIILTANSAENIIAECITFDVDAFLVKPVNKSALEKRIQQISESPKLKKSREYYLQKYQVDPTKQNKFALNGDIVFNESDMQEIQHLINVEKQSNEEVFLDEGRLNEQSSKSNKSQHFIRWQKHFEIGEPFLDESNQEFVSIINDTHELIQYDNFSLADFELIIIRFRKYIDEHLQHEELLLRKKRYTSLNSHLKMHYQLIKQSEYIILKCQADPELYASDFFKLLRFWWVSHTVEEDQKYKDIFQ